MNTKEHVTTLDQLRFDRRQSILRAMFTAVVAYFILSMLLYLALSANVGLLFMLYPGM